MFKDEKIFYKVRNCIFFYIGECRLYQYLLRVKPDKYVDMSLLKMISAILNDMRLACQSAKEINRLRGLESLVYRDMKKCYSYYL